MKILRHIRKNDRKVGFTIIEVVVATIIFTLAIAGIFASVSELREPAVESTQEVAAAFVGKRVLENLRQEVSAETWDSTGNLMPGNTYTLDPIHVGGTNYIPTYTVEVDPNGTSARRVTLNISW